MTEEELLARLRRIYAAVNASKEFDMNKMPAKIIKNDKFEGIFQDFSGGLSEEDIHNVAHTVIHNIANLQDHLRRWARKNGKEEGKIETTFKASEPLKLIQDLSNNDKHGYPPRNDGCSGLAPKVINISRVMQMTTKPEAGSSITMTFGPGGIPQISGDGTACAIITGDVVDKDDKKIGDLFEIEQVAVSSWEALLPEFGLVLGKT